eukprot:GHUV01026908.1.p1 GENE.GHUV01026908.1~~GHUV01026908.1.p1  ORF type:complete len:418 (+),score=116.02 GHUV01026908.1:150-1403(+)
MKTFTLYDPHCQCIMSPQTLAPADSSRCAFLVAKRALRRRRLQPAAFMDRDSDREKARRYRRPVFDSEQWKQHRSVKRYYAHIAGISILVCSYHTLLDVGLLHKLLPAVQWPAVALPSNGVFSISTFALSLLLVFRTNSSYERWWEARDCWRLIVNECTHLARQAEQWLPGPGCQPVREGLLRWLRVFPLSLMVHLRGHEEELEELVQRLLTPDEAQVLMRSKNRPLLVLSAMGQLLAVSNMRIESKTHMDESVRVLQEALGSCEKILTTPIPISYTRHTGRFLVLWLTCLPFVIWQELGWFSVPISMVVSFLLFGIEEIGVQIEEPFGILAVESYCEEVSAGIDQATEDANALLPITAKLISSCSSSSEHTLAAAVAGVGAGNPVPELLQQLHMQQRQQQQQEQLQHEREVLSVEK